MPISWLIRIVSSMSNYSEIPSFTVFNATILKPNLIFDEDENRICII